MFDFQNLEVYKKAKTQHKDILNLVDKKITNRTIKDQLARASISIVLNIAEGTGRFTNADKRNFYIIARSSIFECVAILDLLIDNNTIEIETYDSFFEKYEELSKMLYGLIKSLG